jgi:xylulokinase
MRSRRARGFDTLVGAAADVAPGSDGLFFLPYLTGERSPHPDPLARGAFIGLTLGHDRRHLTRAVLEGVAFGLRDGLDLMTAAGMPHRPRFGPPAVAPRARSGGRSWPTSSMSRSRPSRRPREPPTAPGCSPRSGPAGGERGRATDAVVRVTPVASPGPDAPAYAERHAIYRDLYPALRETFPRL